MSSVRLSPELIAIRTGRIPSALVVADSLANLSVEAPLERFLIRRSGGRPLSFSGMLLISHENTAANESDRRHAIRLYETADGSFVVEVALFAQDDSVVRHSIVEVVNELSDAEAFLASYAPSKQAQLALVVDEDLDADAVAGMANKVMVEANRLREDFELARHAVFAATRQDDAEITFRRDY